MYICHYMYMMYMKEYVKWSWIIPSIAILFYTPQFVECMRSPVHIQINLEWGEHQELLIVHHLCLSSKIYTPIDACGMSDMMNLIMIVEDCSSHPPAKNGGASESAVLLSVPMPPQSLKRLHTTRRSAQMRNLGKTGEVEAAKSEGSPQQYTTKIYEFFCAKRTGDCDMIMFVLIS